MKEKKLLRIFLVVIMLFIVLFLSVGYSAFNFKVLINDLVATVRPDKNVRITAFNFASSNNGGYTSNVDYSVSSGLGNLLLPNSNSTVTYTVSVKNYGNVEMGISKIVLPTELENILDISAEGYTIGTKLRDNNDSCEESANGCTLSINRTFNITVQYKSGAYNSNNTEFNNFKLDFVFAEAYKVKYTGFTNPPTDINAYSVLAGNTYSQNIGEHESLKVKMGGVVTTNYTIDSSNNLTIPAVTGELEIIQEMPVKINVNPSNATIKYSINGGDEQTVTGNLDITVPVGATLEINVSATSSDCGYRDYSETFTNITRGIEKSIVLDKYYNVTIKTTPSDATITYKVDDDATQTTTGTLKGTVAPGLVIDLTVSKDGYVTTTKKYTVNSHINETITLTPNTYTYTVTSNIGATINISSNIASNQCSNSTSCSLSNVSHNTSVTYTVSADYHQTQSGSDTITSNFTRPITLAQKATQQLYKDQADSSSSSTGVSDHDEAIDVIKAADLSDVIYANQTLSKDHEVSWHFTNFSGLPDDAKITSISGRYQINAGGSPMANTVFTVGSRTCFSEYFEYTHTGKEIRSLSCSFVPTVAEIKSGIRVSVKFEKLSSLTLYQGIWHAAEITINYIPK